MSQALLVTGGSGLLGSAVVEHLNTRGRSGAVLAPRRAELDLLDGPATLDWFREHRPGRVIHLAGHVRGLAGNMGHQLDGLVLNSRMGLNVISACAAFPPERLVIGGSTSAYAFPFARLPLMEDDLLAGDVHPGEHGYASAHRLLIAGADALRRDAGVDARVAVLTNLFGPRDRFEGTAAHVVPALIARFTAAADAGDDEVAVWGNPGTTRDLMYSEDAAAAVVAVLDADDAPGLLNVASGTERTMGEIAATIATATGYEGSITWDDSMPVGGPRRAVDVFRLRALMPAPEEIGFDEGVRRTMAWYRDNRPGG